MRLFQAVLVLAMVPALPVMAETTLSKSNKPTIGLRLSALMLAERDALAALPSDTLTRRQRGEAKAQPAVLRYDSDWVAAQAPAAQGREWECLSRAVYFEARGEALPGQFAVAEVVLNRVDSPAYPGSVCAVVSQSNRGGCQFSFVCDGKPDSINEREAWNMAGKVAALMLSGAPRALTQGATHFHTGAVRPSWSRRFPRTASIGTHHFYRQPVSN